MLEKELERKFVNILRKKGCIVYKFVSPGNAGVPDRLVITPKGTAHFAELKQKGKLLRPLQVMQAKRLAKNNVKVHLVDSLEAIQTFIEEVLHSESDI